MNDLRSSVQKPFLRRPPCLKGGDFEEPRLQVCLRRDWPNLWQAEVSGSIGIWNFFKKRIKWFNKKSMFLR